MFHVKHLRYKFAVKDFIPSRNPLSEKHLVLVQNESSRFTERR